MKDKKKLITIIILIIAVIVACLFYREFVRKPTITSYQDTSGAFYECSQPIAAKKAMIPHLGSTSEGLVPSNQFVAKRLCHMTGIE